MRSVVQLATGAPGHRSRAFANRLRGPNGALLLASVHRAAFGVLVEGLTGGRRNSAGARRAIRRRESPAERPGVACGALLEHMGPTRGIPPGCAYPLAPLAARPAQLSTAHASTNVPRARSLVA